MKKFVKPVILCLLLVALSFVVSVRVRAKKDAPKLDDPAPSAPVESVPLAEPEYFTISAIGDCTLNTPPSFSNESSVSYASRMNGDYAYPFSNTVQYFANDDLTIANLECTLSDHKLHSYEMFYFISPSEYAQIMTLGGVDFVTTANNHMEDFGDQGVADTYAALEAYGLPYGKEGQAQIITTERGLKVGIYCDYNSFKPDEAACVNAINQLKMSGAEYIICMFHLHKQEIQYTPSEFETELAHACIDAGANLIYSSHPHCLQPIEQYNGGYILYSMGNWTFGGHTSPTDPDTAIVQITLCRYGDGHVSNEKVDVIPCAVSSRVVNEGYTGEYYNDFCPTPYPPDSEGYSRTMSKLFGTYDGGDVNVDYSNWWASRS